MSIGVGGRSVDEAKATLSWTEFLRWQGYIERRGTLHLGMRMEAGFALIAFVINKALGGHATIENYMLHLKAAEPEEGSIEDVMKELFSVVTPAKAG